MATTTGYVMEHRLGKKPRWVLPYLSFSPHGTKDATVTPASGNDAVILAVDDTTLTIANDTCADYFLLVIAGSGTP